MKKIICKLSLIMLLIFTFNIVNAKVTTSCSNIYNGNTMTQSNGTNVTITNAYNNTNQKGNLFYGVCTQTGTGVNLRVYKDMGEDECKLLKNVEYTSEKTILMKGNYFYSKNNVNVVFGASFSNSCPTNFYINDGTDRSFYFSFVAASTKEAKAYFGYDVENIEIADFGIDFGEGGENCDEILGDNLVKIVKFAILSLRIAAAIIALVVGMLTLIPPIVRGEASELKKSTHKLVLLAIVLVLVALLPTLLNILGKIFEWDISCIF